MRIPSIVSHDAELDTYLVLDDVGGRLGCAWRASEAENADRATLIRDLLDGPMTMACKCPTRRYEIMGYDTGPGGDHCAQGLCSTASTLLNEEGAFNSDAVEAQLVRDTGKKRRPRDEVVRRQLGDGDQNKIRVIYDRAAYWAERVRLTQHWSDRLDK